ncbi:hypothetical protein N7471_006727 [Penicillium samsonianum]|uniref:uncharacterized protein n=1 Tax=Penicillium samsonianum TaxID=1882272 RepID=UPI002548ED27|nr:uncharacterized protein N7471_006727 [Penicillium samsonianum]KAJ6140241.1 hypothetical protein N7471_006727 [Penicillium samsonianum]
MVTWSFTTALRAVGVGLLLAANGAVATQGFKSSASPGYNSIDVCPERCSVSGPNTGNWSVYPDFKKIKKCKETMFYEFSLYDPVDNRDVNHKIHACSSFGPDFSEIPASTMRVASGKFVDVEFEVGWWEEGFGLATSGLRSLVKQVRHYVEKGHGATDRPFIMYGQSGQATVGLYIGQGLLNQGLAQSALKLFQDNMDNLTVSAPSLAMQLCEQNYDSTHIFGIIATSNGTFTPIQEAIKSWSNATCLSFEGSTRIPGSAIFTTPLINANRTIVTAKSSATTMATTAVATKLHARAECRTVQVDSGNGCPELAVKCGISAADFTKYNPASNFCSNLKPKQHVCCSQGTLPDFSPKPNADGSCYAYEVKDNDNCDDLATEWSLTRQNLEDFNKNTWGWNGCDPMYSKTVMCLSKGTAPFPAEIANAQCGPQKPGSKPPTDGSDISDLNPCPLNACCNIWGQCGITKDFCVDTNTGPPGTAKKGTYGCISNCGMDVVKGSGSGAIKIAYYEGYNMKRECLFQDASQIDTSKYTHIHFGFGTLTPSYDVETGDVLSSYNFGEFKKLSDVKKILSFGGWDFSTMPDTYQIFRNGVKPANRLAMAQKIATFIKDNNLDGVDIDWEYPGAPDLPENDPGSKEDGPNYLAFLVVLKNLLPGKSISIAAPASYWYLKQFPIAQIGKIVDYIVYMTYDLHGQWDANSGFSQEGCDTGNCLRSQVNLTETRQSLAMITKAGVPGNKVIVGVTSYGRSFKMAEAGCHGPNCLYTGDRLNSNAKKGKCTATAGYIADAEIAEILNNPKRAVTEHFVDTSSNSDILVYEGTEYVSYMSATTKAVRAALYAAWGLGGTSDWAVDLQTYNEPPNPAKTWLGFFKRVVAGEDPKVDDTRNGNWTDFDCTHKMVIHPTAYLPSDQWKNLNADAAWADVVRIWTDTDQHKKGVKFIQSVSETLHMGKGSNCGQLTEDSCVALDCPAGANGDTSGPAAQLIWDSLVRIHHLHKDYYETLFQAGVITTTALDDLENKFAPIPPEEDNTWLLLLIDVLTLGTLGTAAPFFNTVLKKLPYFLEKSGALDNFKDTTMTMVGQGTTIAKDLLPSDDPNSRWNPQSQDAFSNYMAQVVDGWANVSSLSLEQLFNGKPNSIKVLEEVMSNGKLITGKFEQDPPEKDETTTDKDELRTNIEKCFFGYSIPALWQASKAYAFIIDTGHACGGKELTDYLADDTMSATGACVDGQQYYLVYPDGDATICKQVCHDHGPCTRVCTDNKFSAPPGLDSLGGVSFGGITTADLIKGSVRTWKKNGKANGGGFADPTDQGTINNLMNVDVTTPGFMRIPVCSPERAFKSWDTAKAGSSDYYPCDIPPGRDTCGDSTFENQTSDGSPLVEDCLIIIKNIQGDASTDYTTLVAGKPHREVAPHGTCAFGVEATSVNGNANFVTGGQDVIDIINESVKRFASNGKVGAKGNMVCNGNIKDQAVKWGIYST